MKLFISLLLSVVFLSCVSTIPHQETVPTGLTDIANMFNERGYYKSNAISQDEQEIINDFNGNLLYNIPLYNYALAGDLNFNLSLNYNGSVAHQIIVGHLSDFTTGLIGRLNMNSPEWIINLNGIAIQTLNFETSFFTNDVIANEITGDNVKSLIPGNHFDGSLEAADADNPYNRIQILAGDGSQFVPTTPDLYLKLNVYDTLSSAFVNIFNPPNDYGIQNMTKGHLAATAYRTRYTDNWSYKYFRYDERGRVIKLWNIIDGLATQKTIYYTYNSQDQIVDINYGVEPEIMLYKYSYDYAGRMYEVGYSKGDPSLERAAIYTNFTIYSYNPNSLIDFQHFNSYQIENNYQYNSRNWITSFDNNLGQFSFSNTYFKNGNLNTQLIYGTYRDFMQNRYNLNYKYSYDYSNRLLSAQNINQGDNTYSTYNTYDKDGNITTLKRYGDNNALKDNFVYAYSPGTNKTIRVSGAADQFSFDLNGNTIHDDINGNYDIKYDYRNLITGLYHKDPASETRPNTYATRYYYDESGNRVRKFVYVNSQVDPPPITDWSNPGNGWVLLNNEFYVKGVDGKDLATYEGQQLQEWYVWGNDIVGKLKGDKAYYYFKDHLGSVRVVVDNTGAIVAGFDYDAWGYPLENRNYNGDSIKYKYTGKELDKESFYDYFGARYYDARIGRWGMILLK